MDARVVDSGYRGELAVILFNHSTMDFPIRVGDRIAQFIVEKIKTPDDQGVKVLDETSRGEGGFGSIGMQSGGQWDLAQKNIKNGFNLITDGLDGNKGLEEKESKCPNLVTQLGKAKSNQRTSGSQRQSSNPSY